MQRHYIRHRLLEAMQRPRHDEVDVVVTALELLIAACKKRGGYRVVTLAAPMRGMQPISVGIAALSSGRLTQQHGITP